jgi:hypothetical protein
MFTLQNGRRQLDVAYTYLYAIKIFTQQMNCKLYRQWMCTFGAIKYKPADSVERVPSAVLHIYPADLGRNTAYSARTSCTWSVDIYDANRDSSNNTDHDERRTVPGLESDSNGVDSCTGTRGAYRDTESTCKYSAVDVEVVPDPSQP